MSQKRPSRRPAKAKPLRARVQRFALVWRLAWAIAVAAGAAAMVATGLLSPGMDLAALGVGVAAGLVGALLALSDSRAARVIDVLVWGLAAALACQMTGGAGGPLAPWCLAPLAAAAAYSGAGLLPLGAAVSLAAAALTALGAALLPLPHPAAACALWMSLLALVTVALGLAAALLAMAGAVTRRARAQDDTEAELRQVLDHQPLLLLDLAPAGHIVAAFGEAPAGRAAADFRGAELADVVHPDDWPQVWMSLERAAAEGHAEVAFAPADDPDGWRVLTLRHLEKGRLAGALRDARTQKARETELDQARIAAEAQNAGKSRFLANMSHELRTPLNAIMGFSDIMKQRLFGPLSDRYAEYAQLIHESGAHLLELINDVLDMSKIEAERFELSLESFDAREAASAVLRLMRGQAERAGVHLRGDLPAQALEADADRRAIKQIALNLLSNALKFTPRGGSVTLALTGQGKSLELSVTDTGLGISPEDLARLGRPFEQAGDADQKAAGSGLGLSLVRALAKLHGGDMTMESTVGEGTTVTVRLPVLILAEPVVSPYAKLLRPRAANNP